MHRLKILDKLKTAICINDINAIFKNTKFPNENGSYFKEDKIFGHKNSEGSFYSNIKLSGDFKIAFKIMVFLKLCGLSGSKPFNSGITHWINSFQSILFEITNNKDINSVQDITSEHIDIYIDKQLKNITPYTIKKKISYLKDWISFGNQYLPHFLQIDETLIFNSKSYRYLVQKSNIQRSNENLIINSRKSYPINLLKILLSNSSKYIDSYSEDILYVSKYYVKRKNKNISRRYLRSLDFLYSLKKENYLNKKLENHLDNSNKIYSILKEEIETLEAACVFVILFLTGMRIGELVSLKRFPKITEGEYFNLSRLIYKTAPTEKGIELEMPIPEITKKAIEILSKISDIKDNGLNKELITTSIMFSKVSNAKSTRIRNLIRWYAKKLNIKEKIDPHQLRHAMAFLIVHLNEKDGLELAKMFLGHTSIGMTLQYMGHYNRELSEAIKELSKEESEIFVEKISNQIKQNKKLFGENAKRLIPSHKFVGRQADDFIVLMKNGLLKLIEEQKLAIIQTPISLCIHDLSKPEQLACQRGFNIESIVMNGPAPSRCKGANCSNSLFFEEHIEKLKNDMYGNIDPELKLRLEQNTYFIEAGGFEQDPFRKIIKEYNEYKERQING